MNPADHPAKFSVNVLKAMTVALMDFADLARGAPFERILDPFAGTGLVHRFGPMFGETVGVELEPEWAAHHPRTIVGDAQTLPFPDDSFDCMITSPCYGNRMADHHEAKDASKRNTYRHTLGRELSPGSTATVQWGSLYREIHFNAWWEAQRVLTPDALVLLNVSNHIRGGVEQMVAEWHLTEWLDDGFKLVSAVPVPTSRNRNGANAHLRVDHEWLFVLRGQG